MRRPGGVVLLVHLRELGVERFALLVKPRLQIDGRAVVRSPVLIHDLRIVAFDHDYGVTSYISMMPAGMNRAPAPIDQMATF